MSIKICLNCNKEFETNSGVKKFCCKECQLVFESKAKNKDTDAITCKICGFMGHKLKRHIETSHHITQEEYCKRFNVTPYDLISESAHHSISQGQKRLFEEGRGHGFTSENNPSNSKDCKNGRNSPYSMNFRGYDGLTDEEKQTKINALKATAVNKKTDNNNNPLTIEYYIKRGMSKTEAEIALKERQTTFTFEKCIERYGEEEGKRVYAERQERWQNTLNNKPLKEIERINRAKMSFNGYSNMSQTLFWKIYDSIKNDYNDIYFATFNPTTKEYDDSINKEYFVHSDIGNFFLDFYVKDCNKIIEFDGDYWHGEKRGNQKREEIRENKLNKMGYTNILHIKERDYKSNPQKVIEECLNYLNS